MKLPSKEVVIEITTDEPKYQPIENIINTSIDHNQNNILIIEPARTIIETNVEYNHTKHNRRQLT